MSFRLMRVLGLVGVLLAWAAWAAPVTDRPPTGPELSEKTLPSVAWVVAGRNKGTGWLVDRGRRLLITNHHVVGDEDGVEVVFPLRSDGKVVTEREAYRDEWKRIAVAGRVLKRDPDRDLALVQLQSAPEGAVGLTLAREGARPGDRVLSLGNRRDSEALWVCTVGRVRAVCRTDEGYFWQGTKLARGATVLVTDSPILEGDSGGPVVNDHGELVGVAAAVRWQAPLTSVAVDVSEVRAFLAKADTQAEPLEGQPSPERAAERDVCARLLRATAWLKPGQANSRPAGFLLDRESRLLLTSSQAVGNADSVEMVFSVFRGGTLVVEHSYYRDTMAKLRETGRAVRGTVLARDAARNLAVVELASVPDGVEGLKLAESDPLPGEPVHSVSHPGSSEALWMYAGGAVRQVCRARLASGEGPEARAVLLQLPGGAAEGGSAVVNDAGDVVAVLTGREAPQQLLSYGAAVSEVRAFLTENRPRWSPDDAGALRQRAVLYVRTRQYDRAAADLDRAVKLRPEEPGLFAERARVRRLRGDLDGALADCEEARKKDGKWIPALVERAAVLLARGDLEKADADAREAARLDPKSAAAFEVLAEIELARGDRDQAIRYGDAALERDPNLAAAYLTRGRALLGKGELERADVEFTRAAEFDPLSVEAYCLRAEVYRRQREWKRALADCEQALEVAPDDPRTYFLRGSIRAALGEADRALADRLRAAALLLKK